MTGFNDDIIMDVCLIIFGLLFTKQWVFSKNSHRFIGSNPDKLMPGYSL